MKSLMILFGWVVVGAVLAFGGQQVWKAFKANNPERSKVIAEKVNQTVEAGSDAISETADAVREEVAKPADEPKPLDANPTDTVPTETAPPAAKAVAAPVTKPEPKVTKVATEKSDRESTVEERFYAIAAGDGVEETETIEKEVEPQPESAADYERRQDANRRKEEVLMQRQMRIVDELTSK